MIYLYVGLCALWTVSNLIMILKNAQRTTLLLNHSKKINITALGVRQFSPDNSTNALTAAECVHKYESLPKWSNQLRLPWEVYNQSLLIVEGSAARPPSSSNPLSAASGLNVETSCREFPALGPVQNHINNVTQSPQSTGGSRFEIQEKMKIWRN